jgi:hypothetical protein
MLSPTFLLLLRVFFTAGTCKPLTKIYIYIYIDTDWCSRFLKNATEIGCFMQNEWGFQSWWQGLNADTQHTAWGSMRLLLFFKLKETGQHSGPCNSLNTFPLHALHFCLNGSTRKYYNKTKSKQTPWSESASELYRPSDRRLSAKWVPTFADRGVSRGQRDGSLRPYSRFSRQEPVLFYQVAPQLYSRGWVDPIPDPLFFSSGSAGNRTRASGSVAKNSDH